MNNQASLADRAVTALAAVSRIDAAVDNEHEERHHIRTLKRLAEQVLADAFTRASELAWLAEDIQKEAAKRRGMQGGSDGL